jgi:hypothetical protein
LDSFLIAQTPIPHYITYVKMKASILTAALAVVAASTASPLTRRDVQKALQNCQKTANPNTCSSVVTQINGWDTSVNMVNLFLNTALNLDGQTLTDAEFQALRFANLEPGFLGQLSSTAGLSDTGKKAAATLGQVFPNIPNNLTALTQSALFVDEAVNNINNLR